MIGVLIFAGAVALFAIFDAPVIAAFVPAYLTAWAVAEVAARRGILPRWSRSLGLLAGAALLISGVVLAPRARAILETDQLLGLEDLLADRGRLEALPAIAPAVVSSAEPQSFFISAPGASSAFVRFGDGAPLSARDLGFGLFRLDYDPRRDGPPSSSATLVVDGREHARALIAVTPRAHPRAFCSSRDGGLAGIAAAPSEETDELFIADRASVRTATTADGPTACAISAAGKIFVVHRFSPVIAVYDAKTAKLERSLPGPIFATSVVELDGVLAIGVEDPRQLVFAGGGVSVPVPLNFTPDELAFGPDGSILASGADTHALHRIARDAKLGWREVPPSIPIGRPIVALATSADGARAYLTATDYRPDGGPGPNHHLEDQLIVVDARAMRIAARIPAGGASPMQIAVTGEDRVVFACAGSDALVEVRERAVHARKIELARPYGVASLGGGLLAVSSPVSGTVAIFDERGMIASKAAAGTASRGELAFWEATRSGASCQTCHLDADTDHALHDIGQPTARPTLSVRGIARTAPYLRGASYDRIGGLQHFADTILGGYESGGDAGERAEALAEYVSSLPLRASRRRFVPLEASLERAGVEAFVKARCVMCHRFPAFTSLAQYPAGFLFPSRRDETPELLDVPSLLGVRSRAPRYLHDGAIDSIARILTDRATTERHGDVSKLSAREREMLIAFLESL